MTNIHTAAQYREMAAESARRNQESWERSDNDGFLSQWASQQMQVRYLNNAEIVEDGGVMTVVVVEIATGEIIATMEDQRKGDYGDYFLITDDAAAARTKRFLTESNARSEAVRERNNAKKGIRIEMVRVPIEHCYESRETGRIEYDWDYVKSLKGKVFAAA